MATKAYHRPSATAPPDELEPLTSNSGTSSTSSSRPASDAVPTSEAVAAQLRHRAAAQGGRDLRFEVALDTKVPWSSIGLALFLLALGSLCFMVAFMMHREHIGGEQSQVVYFVVVGLLAFLPGFYESRNAYYAWRGAKGYRFSHIPSF